MTRYPSPARALHQQGHRCDDDCTCPVHGNPLLYAPASNQHACQAPDCEYAQGFELTYGPRYIDVAALRAARDLVVKASPAYQRAQQAGDDFAANMDRLITQAAPDPASIEAIGRAILSLADKQETTMTETRFTAPATGRYDITWAPALGQGEGFLVDWIPGPWIPAPPAVEPVTQVVRFESVE